MPHEHLFIVTGVSRGLGLGIAGQLLAPGHVLLGIARHPDASLVERARAAGAALEQWSQDLAQPVEAAARLEAWLATLDGPRFASATLVNNAALLVRAGPVQDVPAQALSLALRVGLEAPLMLTSAFLRATRAWPGQRRVLDISSGLGRRAMAGSAAYCAVKAGLDHHARSVALDEARLPHGAKIVSLAPGVIDTDMQVQLRSSDLETFPDGARFRDLHSGGQLSSPQDAARRVLTYLNRPDFGQNPVADVRDA
jgi:NAD(P)-dependent dehydrogenase (short-subunit alcohol dehydrogenase family)